MTREGNVEGVCVQRSAHAGVCNAWFSRRAIPRSGVHGSFASYLITCECSCFHHCSSLLFLVGVHLPAIVDSDPLSSRFRLTREANMSARLPAVVKVCRASPG